VEEDERHDGRYPAGLPSDRDLGKAIEALEAGNPDAESSDALRFLDHALSYAHTAIDDLLHGEGLPPHDPMEFAKWYDAAEVPFKEEW